MAENQENPKEARPDNDDIANESALPSDNAEFDLDGILNNDDIANESALPFDKSELDLDGIPDNAPLEDKALLDTEGPFGDQELQPEQVKPELQKPEKPDQSKEVEGKKKPAWFLPVLAKLKQLPWIKISAVFAGASVLFVACWFIISYFLFPINTAETVDVSEITEETKEVKGLEMEPFIIPFNGPKQGKFFLKVKILINLKDVAFEKNIKKEMRNIRLEILNLLSKKNNLDFTTEKRLERLKVELQNILNNVLKKDVVKDVELLDVLLV